MATGLRGLSRGFSIGVTCIEVGLAAPVDPQVGEAQAHG